MRQCTTAQQVDLRHLAVAVLIIVATFSVETARASWETCDSVFNNESAVVHLSGVVELQGCVVDKSMVFPCDPARPLTLVLKNITGTFGGLAFTPTNALMADVHVTLVDSRVEVQSSVLVANLQMTSAVVRNVSFTVIRSVIRGTSAVACDGNIATIDSFTATVVDSVVTVGNYLNTHNAIAVVARLNTAGARAFASNVSLVVVNSTIYLQGAAQLDLGSLTMAVGSEVTVTDVNLKFVNSRLILNGRETLALGSISLRPRSGPIRALIRGVSLVAINSTLRATSATAGNVVSFGVLVDAPLSSLIVEDAFSLELCCGSTISADSTANVAVAAGVFAFSDNGAMNASLSALMITATDSTVTAAASSFSVALAIHFRSGAAASTLVVNDSAIAIMRSQVLVIARSQLANIATIDIRGGAGSSHLAVRNATLASRDSNLTASATDIAAIGSIAARATQGATVDVRSTNVVFSKTVLSARVHTSFAVGLVVLGESADMTVGVHVHDSQLVLEAGSQATVVSRSLTASFCGIIARSRATCAVNTTFFAVSVVGSSVNVVAQDAENSGAVAVVAFSQQDSASVAARAFFVNVVDSRVALTSTGLSAIVGGVQSLKWGISAAGQHLQLIDSAFSVCNSTLSCSRSVLDAQVMRSFNPTKTVFTVHEDVNATNMTVMVTKGSILASTGAFEDSTCLTAAWRATTANVALQNVTVLFNVKNSVAGELSAAPIHPPSACYASGVLVSDRISLNETLKGCSDVYSSRLLNYESRCGAGVTIVDVNHTNTRSATDSFNAPRRTASRSQSVPASTNSFSRSSTRTYLDDALSNTSSVDSFSRSATSTLSFTVSSQRTRNRTDAPSTQQPVMVEAPRRVTLDVILPTTAAEAVVGTATTSTVIASLLGNPSTATQITRVGRVAALADCSLGAGGGEPADADDPPSTAEMPLRPLLHASVNFPASTGALLTTAGLFIALPSLAHVFCGRFIETQLVSLQVGAIVSAVSAVCTQYFVPSCVGLAARLLSIAGSATGAVENVAAVVSLLVCGGCLARIIVVVGAAKHFASPDALPITVAKLYSPFFDAARDLQNLWHRVNWLEELLASVLTAVVVSVAPGRGCSAKSVMTLLVALLHAGYLAKVRPLRTKLDAITSGVNATLQLTLAVTVAYAVLSGNEEGAKTAIGVLALLLFIYFFVSSVVGSVWFFVLSARRRARRRQGFMDDASNPHSQILLVESDEGSASATTSSNADSSVSVVAQNPLGSSLPM